MASWQSRGIDLSTPRFIFFSTPKSFIPNPLFSPSKAASLSPNPNLKKPGLIYFASPLPRASTSEETNTSFEKAPDEAINTKAYFERAPDEAMTTDTQSEQAPDEAINVEPLEKAPISTSAQFDKALEEAIKAEPQFRKAPDEAFYTGATFEEVSDKAITTEEASAATLVALEYGNLLSILVYGSGALVALWILLAIVGAIDSIPLLPKVLEVTGLAYTVWFSYRYLIFKKNRDELSIKIEELKHQIIGSTDD